MSASPWSARLGIDVLEANDFFLAVDDTDNTNKKVTSEQILFFIENNLSELNKNLNMRQNNLNFVGDFRGVSGNPTIGFRNPDNVEILDLRATTTPANFNKIISADAGSAPELTTDGTGTNIDLFFETKGTGIIKSLTSAEAEKRFLVNARLQLTEAPEIDSADNLTVGDGNVFQIKGNIPISRMDTTDWADGSIVVLHLLGNNSGVNDNASNESQFVHFQLRGPTTAPFLGPGILTVFLGTDASETTSAWIEISRTSL